MTTIQFRYKGSSKSGNYGHAGRPGKLGGSQPKSASGMMSVQDANRTITDANNMLMDGFWIDAPKQATYTMRGQAKANIVEDLVKRTGWDSANVSGVVNQWASTSNDSDATSLLIQESASRVFDAPMSEWQLEKLAKTPGYHNRDSGPEWADYANHVEGTLQAIYDSTQERLAKAGITGTVRLYRGLSSDALEGVKTGRIVDYHGSTLESWTTNKLTAMNFAASAAFDNPGGVAKSAVLAMDVPVKNIASCARTGMGCLTESEFIVLGSKAGYKARIEGRLVDAPPDSVDYYVEQWYYE
jgi:hypothetical protein